MSPAAPSVSNSITVRLELPARATAVSEISIAVEEAGGMVTAVDITESGTERLRADLTVSTRGADHAPQVVEAMRSVTGVQIHKVSDRTFLVHLGGKLSVESKLPIRNRDDLSLVYTPGVARVCQAIVDNPEDARRLTIKRNTVAVVTDGTAVLGMGDIGPLAAMPVMEGKAALFKRFADIDAFPICLDTQDADEIVRIVKAIAPGFAGINLEDISAPRCFYVEARLRDELDIPVFHDDQHGTAIVTVAALRNALRVVNKELSEVKIVLSGAGAAGTAILRLLLRAGARNVVVSDFHGILHPHREDIASGDNSTMAWIASQTNEAGLTGTVRDAVVDADVFIGVSAGDILTGDDIANMNDDAIVFAMANPVPEVDPTAAAQHATVVATGRSDFANQINNVLVFPGVFRGLLDAQTDKITDEMLLAAAIALGDVVGDDERNPTYIIPSVFNSRVTKAVAKAVADVARAGQETVEELLSTPSPDGEVEVVGPLSLGRSLNDRSSRTRAAAEAEQHAESD
ncbi:NAD-dependent malic enzyme [Ornithinicoccus hortensis]|uniref:Malate dehydrogenase (Oxaloacetate-decarboxylating) n=1 Tax=Ornithinicoccus hortensis TaxID=82346 RepID=A0A542YRH0_9MICO|nr:NAD-dependent malic enzyme [Ornithinicoccus hortensis]TQL50695.1 malate dehydrogenase (oxaloacetate-decarboxylating) [Ornithinicoccus hortensis]